jgi:hypothetical protein
MVRRGSGAVQDTLTQHSERQRHRCLRAPRGDPKGQ